MAYEVGDMVIDIEDGKTGTIVRNPLKETHVKFDTGGNRHYCIDPACCNEGYLLEKLYQLKQLINYNERTILGKEK